MTRPTPAMKQDEPDFLMLARGVCPNCGGRSFRPGPRGGLAQNIECRACLRRFSVAVFRGEFFGAQHLFASLNSVLEEGEEPTEKDLRRMENIAAELIAFIEHYKLRHFPHGLPEGW
jgi:hypothetical protein